MLQRVTGIALDPSGSAVPGVTVRLENGELNDIETSVTDATGWFRFGSVPAGIYELQANKQDFKSFKVSGFAVDVTETLRLELHLELVYVVAHAEVSATPLMVQLDTFALGRTVNSEGIAGLPLATRNFSQAFTRHARRRLRCRRTWDGRDRQRWGRASFDRTHRFVFSETWALPAALAGRGRAVLGGWSHAAVAVIQSGNALTIANTNANNVFGISEDRAQLSGACTRTRLVKGVSIESKLNSYFDPICFTFPPTIGADGQGTAFGNSASGIADAPRRENLDFAASKAIALPWPHDACCLKIRAEFFNAFNHPQFGNPDANFASPTFGVISSTSVNPRVVQLALLLSF